MIGGELRFLRGMMYEPSGAGFELCDGYGEAVIFFLYRPWMRLGHELERVVGIPLVYGLHGRS